MSGKRNKQLRKKARRMALGLPEKKLKTSPDVYRRIPGKLVLLHHGTSEHIGCERTIYQQLKKEK